MGTGSGDGSVQGSGRVLGWGLGLFGAALLVLSATHIYGFVDAIVSRAPIIVWDETGWVALPSALSLLALASALYVGRGRGQDIDGPRGDAVKRLLAIAACLLPFAIVLPFSAHWLFARHLETQGYNECVDGVWVAVGRVPDVPETPAACRNLSF
ncbi:hypothetical protein [Erythrobacter donghaensis]|uniref:hypothetical protein n=1 Tax=Erythrobacter donghaensis TaxID=267135 RepID=UPI000A3C7C66|nr:hypothetical protein [Erythrobacter donghaensis]